MNELALFAGAGGGILGGHLLRWRTVCAVEINAYCAGVLVQRQNDGILAPFPIWDDVRTFDGKPWREIVDVVSGGFPCQDISAAGRGAGIDGERSGLWREMARIIREVEPRFVLVENSPILTVRGLGVVLGDLATLGYDAQWGVLGACHAGAPHKRKRIWIVANSNRAGLQDGRTKSNQRMERSNEAEQATGHYLSTPAKSSHSAVMADSHSKRKPQPQGSEYQKRQWTGDGGQNVADAECIGCEQVVAPIAGGTPSERPASEAQHGSRTGGQTWWQFEPNVGRMAHGLAARMDRLTALGNGQVPAVVKLAWETLKP